MQINRRKVFQACQSTGVDSAEHVKIANTLPAMLIAISITGAYDFSEESVRKAMSTQLDSYAHTDAYVGGVIKVGTWMQKNGELPEPVAPVEVETTVEPDEPEQIEAPAEVETPSEVEVAEPKPAARKSRSRAKKA